MEITMISERCCEYKGERFYLCGSYFQHNGKRLHRAVWMDHNGPIPKGYHIHHKDENRSNNEIDNLELISAHDHEVLHGKDEIRKEKARANIEVARVAANKWHGSEAGKEFHSALGKANWANAKLKTYICTNCGKEFQSKCNYPEGSNRFCHQNCKQRFRTARLRHEREMCKATG